MSLIKPYQLQTVDKKLVLPFGLMPLILIIRPEYKESPARQFGR